MSKGKGGLGFRGLYGFKLALLGKHVWKCIHNSNILVSRVLKARYFPESSILNANKGQGTSFIWAGIWQAKEILYRWVSGDGNDIVATKDRWLRNKHDLKVYNLYLYEGRN